MVEYQYERIAPEDEGALVPAAQALAAAEELELACMAADIEPPLVLWWRETRSDWNAGEVKIMPTKVGGWNWPNDPHAINLVADSPHEGESHLSSIRSRARHECVHWLQRQRPDYWAD